MSMPCKCNTMFIVPTKTKDNCSYSEQLTQQVIGQESKSMFDAFQYYSNDLLRLKTLLLISDGDDDELNAMAAVNDALRSAGLSLRLSDLSINCVSKDVSKRRRGSNSQPITIKQNESGTPRKTRLSWELHPSLLLHELYDEVGEDVQSVSVSDGEDNHEEYNELE